NFEMGQGELWCILGPNGVGKTTLFKTLLGLLKAQSGKVFIDGKKDSSWNRRELALRIAYVPQVHVPPFPFLALDVVVMGRSPHVGMRGKLESKDVKIAEWAMDLLEISHLKQRTYTEISGGERQLVLIARAIAQETPVLIMDEPVSNLDFGNQAKVIGHIRKLVKMGKTVVMTSHFPDNAFLPETKVILLSKDGNYRMGEGKNILTEERLTEMYQVDSKIVSLPEIDDDRRVCIPIYDL
ncbi:MAG: ABC transporter ATP-binding protein, partial [Anaerovorax sp.]